MHGQRATCSVGPPQQRAATDPAQGAAAAWTLPLECNRARSGSTYPALARLWATKTADERARVHERQHARSHAVALSALCADSWQIALPLHQPQQHGSLKYLGCEKHIYGVTDPRAREGGGPGGVHEKVLTLNCQKALAQSPRLPHSVAQVHHVGTKTAVGWPPWPPGTANCVTIGQTQRRVPMPDPWHPQAIQACSAALKGRQCPTILHNSKHWG